MPLKVLVIEDDPQLREFLIEVLGSVGADVIGAQEGFQAAAKIDHERFDGIFLDLGIPNIDGLQLARRIRMSAWNRSAPIIVLTGQDDRKTMEASFAAGATFFLQKPVDRNKLLKLFKTVSGPLLENRRRFIRVPLHAPLTCQVGQEVFQGESVNLSQGGMLLQIGRLLQPQMKLRISLRLPGQSATITLPGQVVRTDDKGRVGVEFERIGAEELSMVRELIDREGGL